METTNTKEYTTPYVEVIEIGSCQVICQSGNIGGTSDYNNGGDTGDSWF